MYGNQKATDAPHTYHSLKKKDKRTLITHQKCVILLRKEKGSETVFCNGFAFFLHGKLEIVTFV